MTPSSERSSIFKTPSASRRILYKVASPFSQKTRSISEFTVKAHDPHKQYSPGESVTGAVVVKVVKPFRLTHISVCLHGFVQVHRNPGPQSDAVRRPAHSLGSASRGASTHGKKSGEYFGNGFASLFEDEVVLCGEGRLAEGSYRFDFEVAFPKDVDLPSSIEFERGTISYLMTATLTRPTTMNPTITHDQRLFLCERIDIADLLPPKSRTITLEPVTRKSKPRGVARNAASDKHSRHPNHSLSARTRESTSSSNPTAASSSPTVPAPPSIAASASASAATTSGAGADTSRTPSLSEEASFDSSSLGRRSVSGSLLQLQRTSEGSTRSTAISQTADRTITATVESLKGGCLRGDSIPIRVSVAHTKHVKSMSGVIITLYRLARTDLHPALPLGPMTDGQKRKYEDYYPKSLTGLGGLSLSGAGSSHVFRKDLAQTIVPLIVDPHTLKAEINAKVTVPEDAFPTINTVPGSMISFRYYIEVVLDIQGKLAGSEKFLSQRSTAAAYGGASAYAQESTFVANSEGNNSLHVIQAPSILDTAPIRRDKSVVTSMFEVIVGTLDSRRKKGKARAVSPPRGDYVIDTSNMRSDDTPNHDGDPTRPQQNPEGQSHTWNGEDTGAGAEWADDSYWQYPNRYHYPEYSYDNAHYQYPYHTGYDQQYEYYDPPHMYQPPAMDGEEHLSEKQRLHLAEARLMPSQPPATLAANVSDDVESGPSAPVLLLGPDVFDIEQVESRSLQPVTPILSMRNQGRSPRYDYGSPHIDSSTSRSVEHAHAGSRSSPLSHSDDKQELQRRQLQLNASAPPQPLDYADAGGDSGPSAPNLAAADAGLPDNADHDLDDNEGDPLPRYHR
ncbi:hypothetical protein AAFC00_003562 [Neodothiora populina]|uniref:Arrestin C-terminal-like domain-containing protein n=1 Tax=Neodothiora populina TaxID=2781224 RepID=A0ABR3PEL5_9PEZI